MRWRALRTGMQVEVNVSRCCLVPNAEVVDAAKVGVSKTNHVLCQAALEKVSDQTRQISLTRSPFPGEVSGKAVKGAKAQKAKASCGGGALLSAQFEDAKGIKQEPQQQMSGVDADVAFLLK